MNAFVKVSIKFFVILGYTTQSYADTIDIAWRPNVLYLKQESGPGSALSALGSGVRYSLQYSEKLFFTADYHLLLGKRTPIFHGPAFGMGANIFGEQPKTETFPDVVIETGNLFTADIALEFLYRRYDFSNQAAASSGVLVDDSGVLKQGSAIGTGLLFSSHYWWSGDLRSSLAIAGQFYYVAEQNNAKITSFSLCFGVGKIL